MHKKRIIGLVSILLILVTGALVLFSKMPKVKTETVSTETLGIPVEVTPVVSENIQETLNYIGTIKSKNQAGLSFKSPGIIQHIFVKEGDQFKKGAVLAELNIEDLRAKQEIVEQKIAGAQLNIDYLKDQSEKNQTLYDEGAISHQQFLDIKYKYAMAESSYKEALANAEEIDVSLKNGKIYAPYNGSVRELLKQEGEMAQPGQVVFSVSENGDLILEITVIEKDLPVVKVGTKALLYINNEDKTEAAAGTVSAISSVLNPQTRTANIEISIPPGYEHLLPNMSLSVSLIKGEKEKAAAVPVKALLETPEGYMVYVYQEGKALARKVKVGLNNGKMAEIIEGLKVGEKIITSNPAEIKNGDKVFVYKGVE